jgi:hypothetical protein
MELDFRVDVAADLDEDSETFYVSDDTLRKLWAFINQVCGFLLRVRVRTQRSTRVSASVA